MYIYGISLILLSSHVVILLFNFGFFLFFYLFFIFLFFFMNKKGWRGGGVDDQCGNSYLSVIIVASYPLGPEPC